MDLGSLEKELRERGIDPAWYHLGGVKGEAICIISQADGWHVFLNDRGERADEVVHTDEDAACRFLLHWVAELSGKNDTV